MHSVKNLSPISTSFHRTWELFHRYFLKILFAIAVPIAVGLTLLWVALGVTWFEVKQTTTYEQLVSIFTLSSPTAYMLLLTLVAGFIVQILGLIAGPLVMIERDKIKLTEIFPRAFNYFFRYLRLVLLVAAAVIILYVIAYLLITIIAVLFGLMNIGYIDPALNILTAVVPNIGLLIMMIGFIFAPYLLIQVKEGAYQALVMSVVLVKGNFWSLAVRLLIVMTCLFIIGVALSFIPYFGFALSTLVSSCIMIVYTYVLYEDITTR